jgi:hypothetical protein
MRNHRTQSRIVFIVFCFLLAACSRSTAADKKLAPLDAHINGIRAYEYAKQFSDIGPRWVAGTGHKRAEDYLRAQFAHDALEQDDFTADTPIGFVPMRNFIVRFQGTMPCVYVLASHYDTNYSLRNTSYVGANDGASTTGLLIEFANHLRDHIIEGCSIWLVFFDGEEDINPNSGVSAKDEWTGNDNTYGSRHLAAKWSSDGVLPRIKAFILLDMIGDKKLDVLRDDNSTPKLLDTIYTASKNLQLQKYFFTKRNEIGDDQIPFKQRGVPVADLIDFDSQATFWHTPQDTIDKISPTSLQVVGDVVLETLRLLNPHK